MPTRRSLTKDEILRRRTDIQRVFRSPRGCWVGSVRLRCVPNGLEKTRAVCAGRRKTKSAVLRNRLRRRGRELFRLAKDGIKPGFDLAVTLETADQDFAEQMRDFSAALRRLDLVRHGWNE